MSYIKSTVAALAALSLTAVPAMAQTQAPASKLSVKAARAGSAQRDASKIGGGSTIVAILAAAAVIAGIIIAADGKSKPKSP